MRILFLAGLMVGGFSVALYGQPQSAFETDLAAGLEAAQRSRYAEADQKLHAALAETLRPDANRPAARVVELYASLCDLDLLMSRYDEAISLATKAVETSEASPGADLTTQLGRLAGAYRAAGKTPLAIPVLERTLEIDQKIAADDPKVAVDYDRLGSAYLDMKQLDDARKAYQLALAARVSRLGNDHVDVATTWVNLGVLEDRALDPKAAQADFEKALAISEKVLGPENYGLTGILDRLGRLFSAQKKYDQAEPAFQRSLAIREKVLGPRHSDVAPALDNLGMAYFFDSKYPEAEPLFQRSLMIWMTTQGPTSPLVAQSLDNLGSLYAAQKRYPEAEPFFRKALAIRETHDIESLSNLALLYEATGDMKRSDDYFQRAILVGEKGMGSDHPEVLDTMDEYAVMLRAANRVPDAKKMEAHVKELKDKLTAQKASGPETAGDAPHAGSAPISK